MDIKIELKGGSISMLHSDEVDLSEFGEVEVKRASYVEYCDGKTWQYRPAGAEKTVPVPKGWFVASAETLRILKWGFETRAAALEWERAYYSPGGLGWGELTGEALR